MVVAQRLTEAREAAGYSQDQVALALDVSRPMISYWESGTRTPSDRQLVALARLYGVNIAALRVDRPIEDVQTSARMMFRGAEDELPPEAGRGLREFERFLDMYARLAEQTGFAIHGLRQSPFTTSGRFETTDDARRKAEEVRAYLRLGLGSVGDVDRVAELLGTTVLRVPLGADLTRTISGAFFRHPKVGFSVLVNLDMTPGRRRFTVVHELAHALFHSDRERFVLSFAAKNPRERFADAFAGEFLMPTEGVRRVMEEHGFGPRITDAADVIHLQRFFDVSYATALVRLRQARYLSQELYEEFKRVRPVHFARALGYEPDPEEWEQDAEQWRLRRYPPRFLRLLRLAVQRGQVSIPTAASLVDVSIDEMAQFAASGPSAVDLPTPDSREADEFETSNVFA
jgi:transcriptional regulator with XRE-family HTH domain